MIRERRIIIILRMMDNASDRRVIFPPWSLARIHCLLMLRSALLLRHSLDRQAEWMSEEGLAKRYG